MELRKIRFKLMILGAVFLLCIGFWMIVLKWISCEIKEKKEETQIESFIKNDNNIPQEKEESKSQNNKVVTKSDNYNYIAILEIPNISLKKGLLDINNKYNDIKYNVKILKESNMPNVDNGNLILVAHNGNSNISFFKNLDKLKEGEYIYIYYDNYKYTYRYSYNYEIEKNGQAVIKRDNNKTTISLVTCKKNDKKKQMVYIGYLVNKELINEY